MGKAQLITLIIFVSALCLLIAVFLLAVFLIQRAKTNRFLWEEKLRKKEYETTILKTRIEVQEDTRKNIGVELHDNIGQLLSLANLTLASIVVEDSSENSQKLTDSRALIKRSIGELRQLSKVLHGEMLLREGLEDAIRQELHWLQRNGLYTIEFECSNEFYATRNKEKDLFIFRLVQECLNNIIKHAQADRIRIALSYQREATLGITVQDNGRGFDSTRVSKENSRGLGISNMQERVQFLLGSMEIDSSAEKGTSIFFLIPYP